MNGILDILKTAIERGLVSMIKSVCGAVMAVCRLVSEGRARNDRRRLEKDLKNAEKKVDEACDSGNLSDLLDASEEIGRAKRALTAVIAATLICGCSTTEIRAVKTYEGRYGSVEEAIRALDGAELERGESVWVLSSQTLKRIIKNSGN